MSRKDLQEYAENALSEAVSCHVTGFVDVSNAVSTIEDIESDFDGDSYCPYYHEQVDVIDNHESEFGNDAEAICGEETYTASDSMLGHLP
jgi:hypothetical protein